MPQAQGRVLRAAGENRRNARPPTKAETLDRHDLYEIAVQDPPTEVEFVSRTFAKLRGRPALTLREDFCGTAIFSLAWCESHRDRRAWGVDLDNETLQWGLHNRIQRSKSARDRVTLLHANVLDGVGPKTDVVCGFNFSYWLFETRDALRTYFQQVRRKLVSDGMLFLDAYGGYEVPRVDEVRRKLPGFTYVWRQKHFNPIDNHMECSISFEFSDGSRMDDAFTYAWRLWSLPELRELLLEAGFSRVHVYWERRDAQGEGTGKFYEPKRVDQDAVWWTFIGAER